MPDSPRLRVRLTPAAESELRAGHPWVFADSIRKQNRTGDLGEVAVIYDRKDRFLGLGLFDPESPIRVRALHVGAPQELNRGWWSARLQTALQRREGLFDERTTAYRCLNGESDGWPGLVLDRYNRTLVVKLYTSAWLPRLEEIGSLFDEHLQPDRTVLRLSRNIQTAAHEIFGKDDGTILSGRSTRSPIVFQETGIRFEADVLKGQKTGFFLDQRENRRRVEALALGRDVLNAFSFSGGFSIYAARGGARSATDLDISAHALRESARNWALNQSEPNICACRHEVIQADAFEWLSDSSGRQFGLIILDPPSLARRESEVPVALHAYGRLVESALRHLSTGGILVACSCSAHVPARDFFAVARRAVARSRQEFRELETTTHAPDHPVTFREAHYLKAIYFRA